MEVKLKKRNLQISVFSPVSFFSIIKNISIDIDKTIKFLYSKNPVKKDIKEEMA
jgi:hypothetical protein